MVAIALPSGFADDCDLLSAGLTQTLAIRFLVLGFRPLSRLGKLSEPSLKSRLDRLGVHLRELVLHGQRPLRPGGNGLRLYQLLKFGDQLIPEACRGFSR